MQEGCTDGRTGVIAEDRREREREGERDTDWWTDGWTDVMAV